jgi:3'-5' exoribonuclease
MSSKPTHATIRRLSDLKPGDRGTFFAVLAERTRSNSHANRPYYICRFKDLRRTVTYMVWSDSAHFAACDSEWQAGQFFKVQAVYGDHPKYGSQLEEVEKIRFVNDRDAADGFDPTDLVEQPRLDLDGTLSELLTFITETITDEPLRRLTVGLVERHGDRLKRLPAHEKRFYPFPGGLLQHTMSVARMAAQLADYFRDRYPDLRPPINKDLVAAGAVLHDIGHVAELEPATGLLDRPIPTIEGRLVGHLFLGRDLVRDAAREQGDVNPELLRLLEHLIVTHLDLPEWGSPQQSFIPEALILFFADGLDARMEMFVRCLMRDGSPGPFTERDGLLGQRLLKGREV